MAPYIAALVILIVAILFSVYKGVDGFTVALTDTSTFREFMTRIDATLQRYMLLKQKIDSSVAFNDTLTLPKLKELGFDRAPGETPFSKAISVQLETDILLLTGIMNMFQKALTDGSIKNTDLLKDARANVQVDSFVKILPSIEEIISKREQYYASKAASTPTTTTTTATTAATSIRPRICRHDEFKTQRNNQSSRVCINDSFRPHTIYRNRLLAQGTGCKTRLFIQTRTRNSHSVSIRRIIYSMEFQSISLKESNDCATTRHAC